MKRIRIMGLALVALFTITGIAAASASAALPAFYECAKVKGAKDEKGCSKEGGKGGYELREGFGKGKTFKGKGGTATLHTPAVAGEVVCKAFKDEGKVTGEKAESAVKSTFTGCVSLGKKCTTAGAKAGEIKTPALKGEIGYINAAEHRVGVDLSPESGTELASFNCEGLIISVTGSVIGELSTINKVSKELTTSFTVNGGGFQTYKALEGKSEDVLESLINGSGPFESGQAATALNKGEELELRA